MASHFFQNSGDNCLARDIRNRPKKTLSRDSIRTPNRAYPPETDSTREKSYLRSLSSFKFMKHRLRHRKLPEKNANHGRYLATKCDIPVWDRMPPAKKATGSLRPALNAANPSETDTTREKRETRAVYSKRFGVLKSGIQLVSSVLRGRYLSQTGSPHLETRYSLRLAFSPKHRPSRTGLRYLGPGAACGWPSFGSIFRCLGRVCTTWGQVRPVHSDPPGAVSDVSDGFALSGRILPANGNASGAVSDVSSGAIVSRMLEKISRNYFQNSGKNFWQLFPEFWK